MVLFHHASCDFYYYFYVQSFILHYMFRFSVLRSSDSANAHLPGCFRPWTFLLIIGLNVIPSDSFVSCLDSLQGYSTGEFLDCFTLLLARHLADVSCFKTPSIPTGNAYKNRAEKEEETVA